LGTAKEAMLVREGLVNVAQKVLIKAEVGTECPVHDGIFVTNYNDEGEKLAYAIGTKMVRDGEVSATRKEFMDAIKQAIDEMGMECGICASNASQD
jgi:small-conductance mechanosensitive channel